MSNKTTTSKLIKFILTTSTKKFFKLLFVQQVMIEDQENIKTIICVTKFKTYKWPLIALQVQI